MILRIAISMALSTLVPLTSAHADEASQSSSSRVTDLDRIEVTASKLPSPVARTPASVTEVDGDRLRAQGATDLASALRLVAGVDVSPGGDGGSASSVPALWGLREFDAFLLVVDGVPSGGAFVPALQAVNLANVERIEVLRGAAPVSFGATSFVGVIQVIHYEAGKGPLRGDVHVGSRGDVGVSLAVPMPATHDGGFAGSLLVDADRKRFLADRSGFERGHALYRVTGTAGSGTLGLDIDASVVNQTPASPHPREGQTMTSRFPLDSNVNPADARLNETRFQVTMNYALETAVGAWTTKLSLARTQGEIVRGFLRADFSDGSDVNADGYRQRRSTDELYFDTHVASKLSDRTTLVWGVDHLYGNGQQTSDNFEYAIALDGRSAPQSSSLHTDERTLLTDRRNFSGVYADWRFDITDAWRIDAGVRYNHTAENRYGQVTDLTGPEPATEGESAHRSDNRFSGAIGSSLRLWQNGRDELVAYANYRNTFKPAVVDFGPEAEGGILKPETARSGEFGLKGSNFNGRLQWDASAFEMRFCNLVVSQDVGGLPGLTNGGSERFRGAEIESRFTLIDNLDLQGSWAWHDARFSDYEQLFDGVPTQLRGKRLELSPTHLGGLGLTFAPPQGLNGYVIGSRVGSRYLNKRNTALAPGYTTLDAGIGYRRNNWELRLDASNLSNRRDPVSESELGESQYYRLPGRSVLASLRFALDPVQASP